MVVSRPEELGARCGHSVLAMVTSATHRARPLDTPVTDLIAAGLPTPSVVRMKLFTLDDRLIERRTGSLSPHDATSLAQALRSLLAVPAA